MFAAVVINSNARELNRVFDYIVPAEMQGTICVGDRVFVPFGKGKNLSEGYVSELKEESEFANKEIAKIEDSILSKENIELAKLMSEKYFCNFSDCIKLMLPPGGASKDLTKRVKDKTARFVYLAKEKDEILFYIDKNLKSDKQKKLLNFLLENDGMDVSELEAITEVSKAIMSTLEKKELIKFVYEKIERNPFIHKKISRDEKLVLNEEQQSVYDQVEFMIENEEFTEFLLKGVTGSGKTEVYLQLIEKVLEKGKKALVLVPEISLTPQIIDRFLARFGEGIAVLHSKLSNGERFDEWNKIKNGDAKIIIGARSAIFAPVDNLGIIIIDEAHDSSYKSDMTPRYNAKDLARFIAKQNNIPLILGSATPDVCDYYKAAQGDKELVLLTKRANNASNPTINIVDMRQELAIGNKSMFSEILKEKINENLKNKKQTILFVNRRGYSTFVMCRDCGYVVKCSNCSIALTYHSFGNVLKCHYCGHEEPIAKVCPECSSSKIKYFGTGTQKVESEIEKLFPEATTIRMDIDTVSKKNSHENILNKFKNENIDILIGTQMIVKGHHFPNVTLVGVIAADGALNIGDYRAEERTFQTITQVAGRAGREKDKGEVYVQTYNPDNYAIVCSQDQDYDRFYKGELILRKNLNYPPFCDIILIRIQGENINSVKKVSKKLYEELLKQKNENLFVYKPVPSPVEKIQNVYRWRIVVKGRLNRKAIATINEALKNLDNRDKNVTITVDSNPTNMM